jgi:hypothetical protein
MELKRSAVALAVHCVRLAVGVGLHDMAEQTGLNWRSIDAAEQGVGAVPTVLLERIDQLIFAGPDKLIIRAELQRRAADSGGN